MCREAHVPVPAPPAPLADTASPEPEEEEGDLGAPDFPPIYFHQNG